MTSLQPEYFAEWVIVGSVVPLGSFCDKQAAENYAEDLRVYKGVECKVVHRQILLNGNKENEIDDTPEQPGVAEEAPSGRETS